MAQLKPTLYFFHGLPGSPRDAQLLCESVRKKYDIRAIDFLAGYEKNGLDGILRLIDEDHGDDLSDPIHIAGFSLGAMVAMHVAAARPSQTAKLTLISPAAPLELGDFLPQMAGKPIFVLARRNPKLLAVVTRIQAALLQVAPKFLVRQLFSRVGLCEQALIADPEFQQVVECGMKRSFYEFPRAYRSLLQTYVEAWSNVVEELICETEIWHGEKDSWSPIGMSHALHTLMQGRPKLQILSETEHYSTLAAARF